MTQMLEIVPRLQVLARSSPEDKKILVEKLHALGELFASRETVQMTDLLSRQRM